MLILSNSRGSITINVRKNASTGKNDIINMATQEYRSYPFTDEQLYEIFDKANSNPKPTNDEMEQFVDTIIATLNGTATAGATPAQMDEAKLKALITSGVKEFRKFLNDAEMSPSLRLINTLVRVMFGKKTEAEKIKAGSEYLLQYLTLSDNPNVGAIRAKINSVEFKDCLKKLAQATPTQEINKRLRVFYGPAGTGKTTEAMKLTNDRIIACSNDLYPSKIFEEFDFEDGKPTFTHTAIVDAMINGYPIALDEINLLPIETLRELQIICDGKKSFLWKNRTIEIADGFEIIGTMNLVVAGATYALPEPLVDRCHTIKEFTLTDTQLMSAI